MSRDALNAKIRSGLFTPPDVIVGDRFQGWAPSTVEAYRQQQENTVFLLVPAAAAALVTTIRQAAELVRAYGNGHDPAAGIHRTTPTALHTIAARLEDAIRTITAHDNATGQQAANNVNADPKPEHAQSVSIPFAAVDSIIPAADTDDATRCVQLRTAVDMLTSVITGMPEVMKSAGSRAAIQALTAERDKIISHATNLPE